MLRRHSTSFSNRQIWPVLKVKSTMEWSRSELCFLLLIMSLSFTSSMLSKLQIRKRMVTKLFSSSTTYSLLMETPIQLRSLRDVAERYDLFLFDQFGVLHNGAKPVDGVLSMMEELKRLRKTAVIVSNTSNRAKVAASKLLQMGFQSDTFDGGVVTSGESAYKWIQSLCLAEGRKKCCFITWREGKIYSAHGENSFLASLDIEISSAEDADFIFFHGTQSIASADPTLPGTTISLYEDGDVNQEILRASLKEASRRGIPAICANLDIVAMTPSGAAYMPGLLKMSYENLGGICIGFGKPNAEFFGTAIEMAGKVHRERYGINDNVRLRALHIGDSVHHDIKGASAARLDSILITGDGIHRVELDTPISTDYSECGDIRYATAITAKSPIPGVKRRSLIEKVCDLCDRENTPRPTYILKHCIF